MPRWAMVIDLDKCVACQGCSIACRQENNTPAVSPERARRGGPSAGTTCSQCRSTTRRRRRVPECKDALHDPAVHALRQPPLYQGLPGSGDLHRCRRDGAQNYNRCIGCRFCTVACPYGVRYFNWEAPPWSPELAQQLNRIRVGERQPGGPGGAPQGRGREVHLLHSPVA